VTFANTGAGEIRAALLPGTVRTPTMTRVGQPSAVLLASFALMTAFATAARGGGHTRVVLGSPTGTSAVPHCLVAPRDCGWGTAAPRFLWEGGDLSSEVAHRIRWTNWGHHVTFGIGVHWAATPNGSIYPTPLPIRLRAFSIGRCQPHGPLAYRRLQTRTPDRPGRRMPDRWVDIHVPCALLGH